MEKKSAAALSFLFLVLFVAQEIAVTEANTCETLSTKYEGPCYQSSGCYIACKNREHLVSGRCRDDHRCWCTKIC
ncbi:unnamed protein product [Lathyrus sativus]|nr:unnamed protein product [Lathyrus sativus]